MQIGTRSISLFCHNATIKDAAYRASIEILTGWNNRDKIKRFGDYPVGTLLEVLVNYTKTVVCRVEHTEADYRHACDECALRGHKGTGACLMFDCVERDGKHKILKEVKE